MDDHIIKLEYSGSVDGLSQFLNNVGVGGNSREEDTRLQDFPLEEKLTAWTKYTGGAINIPDTEWILVDYGSWYCLLQGPYLMSEDLTIERYININHII